MTKDTILYVEDEPLYYGMAKRNLEREFLEYKTLVATSLNHVEHILGNGDRKGQRIENVSNIAIVCADGSLAHHTYGWDVVELLQDRGYTGKVIYIGANTCPEEKEHLFDAFSPSKMGDELVSLIREAL